MRYKVLYGKASLSLDVPKKRVVGVLTPRDTKQVPDITGAVRASLRRPYESKPLAALVQGKKSALVISVDNTRPSPDAMLLPILDVCEEKGLKVTVIIATGRHRQMSEGEVCAHLGKRIMSSCRVLQHDAFDNRSMVQRGITKCGTAIRVNREIFKHDVVIGCGIIEPSYLCGWSGARKLLMPGLAHHKSIDNNHYYLTHPDTEIGKLRGNPVSDDAAEFARNLPLHFIVYAVCGADDEYTKIVSGHPVKAHEWACALSRRIYVVKRKQADIVISSAGGWPYDCDLVQGKKAIIPAFEAVKRNGVIIICAECLDGLGAESTFISWLRSKTPFEVVRDVLDRKQFNLGAHGANILARPVVYKNAKVILVTCRKIVKELKGSYVTALTSLEDAWKTANLISGYDASVLFIEKGRRLIIH